MPKASMITKLPFDGFYESIYSAEIDREEESFIEYRTQEYGESDPDYEPWWPEELRLDGSELHQFLFDVTSYDVAYRKLAEWYVAAFDLVAGEALDMERKDLRKRYNFDLKKSISEWYIRPSCGMTFESMDSPREYNFTTDRVYAHISLRVVRELFRRSKADHHETLKTVIKGRFSSYDGFISGYSNRLDSWIEKPLAEWDHNEVETLLIAALQLAGFDVNRGDERERLYYATVGDEGSYQAWDAAVDWPKFERKRTERRAEMLLEWIESDPDTARQWCDNHPEQYREMAATDLRAFGEFDAARPIPYRDPDTPDLFA